MARKFATARTKKISFPRNNRDANVGSCSTSLSVAEKGHFVVYTAEQKRFIIPLVYLNNEIARELFKLSEEEFGPQGTGLSHCYQKVSSGLCSSSSSFHRGHANQQLFVY
ncbi:Auxin-responsive protein [Actinidia chinensis var. chinensis]|uniref:Auxin-responsive protein n=1 Tax=Actinidia chinensis var. chinensis TaxID=1590841 RepID=A0A2R6RNL4_ACTCC|nr:Auxin-responsive protein [Actinidia chinensis var. chinensis]